MVDEPFSAPRSEKLLVQSLMEMLHSTFMLPLMKSAESSVSSLGSLKPSQPFHAFPVNALLEKLIYAEWDHPDKHFLPPKRLSVHYPMEKKFTKKWNVPAVDAAISSMNKSLTCPVDNAQMLKDPTDKRLEFLLKFSFSLAGADTAVVAIGICQSLKDQFRQALKEVPAQQARDLAELPKALCFAIDTMKDSIHQASRLVIVLVHMRRILWLKNWSAEAPCKRLLTGFAFHGDRLFGDDWTNTMISSGKSTLLPVKRKYKCPSFKQTLSPAPGASVSRQWAPAVYYLIKV
ncbi:hypothetical protein AB205_0195340 [Aquarana catesbeiana]|uniref:Lamina-associated polypeptide 2 alpha C-terminal domain-containing protein n=1 Tax=Aquarana catesbeiana TaxID=8400 RepID=A0A2G9RFS0_AQUCT|nr:hypothetical protein AB205_0195340 [Aquarana catesbeiana]